MSNESFMPVGPTVTVAGTTASQNNALTRNGGTALRLVNLAAAVAFIKVGIGAQTATAADIPIAPNSVESMRFPVGYDNIAVILAAGTGNVYVTPGEGI